MFDSQLFSEPSQFVSPQLSAGWKKDNDGKANKPVMKRKIITFCIVQIFYYNFLFIIEE